MKDHILELRRKMCGILFMLYIVILTFEFVDETLVCDHSNESY